MHIRGFAILCLVLMSIAGRLSAQKDYGESSTAEEVIKKYMKACGGKRKLKKIDHLKVRLTISFMGIEMNGRLIKSAPNKYIMIIKSGTDLIDKTVFSGKRGKTYGILSNRELEGEELDDLKFHSFTFWEAYYKKFKYQIELIGNETIDDMETYKIEITDLAGKKRYAYYDAKTYFKVRESQNIMNEDKEILQVVDIFDYKFLKGVRIPFQKTITEGDKKVSMRITFITFKGKVNENIFKIK